MLTLTRLRRPRTGGPKDAAGSATAVRCGRRRRTEPCRRAGVGRPCSRSGASPSGVPARTTAEAAVTLPGVLRLNEQHTVQVTSLLEGKVVSLGAELGAVVRKARCWPRFTRRRWRRPRRRSCRPRPAPNWRRASTSAGARCCSRKPSIRRNCCGARPRRTTRQPRSASPSRTCTRSASIRPRSMRCSRRARQPGEGNRHDELADPYLAITVADRRARHRARRDRRPAHRARPAALHRGRPLHALGRARRARGRPALPRAGPAGPHPDDASIPDRGCGTAASSTSATSWTRSRGR